ncbi:prolipoprotein diacylglyceryl transferase [Mycobacterium sp. SMC-4]|nr:prolipoprotein diacylglyceryl transferase [Mycobacterium sp. SMC-4]UXA20335.1 prolipoprotein diacylglyceryl transferase [Mycobacterium sp. SMC-4]
MTTTLLASFPSPPQGVWYLGPFPVRAYALFIIAGIIAALVIGDRRWVARGGEPGMVYDIALWAVTFGLIGGRLYHVLTDWSTYFGPGGAGFVAALRIWDGGLGIWGAVALGGVGAWIGCRRAGIPLPAFGDAIAPGIILAQALGRLGNYFNQELYGRETTLPWGLEIYERRNAAGAVDFLNGVSTGQLLEVVHPTFLYELLWNLLVFVALLVIDRRFRIGHGRLFALYVAGYCVGRFWIELLRSDFATEIAGVRINSFTATFVFIGAVVYIMAAPRGREDPAMLRGTQQASAEDVVKDLAVGASTTGVVAAAAVAAEEDREEAQSDTDDVGGVGSVEEDELAEAVDDAPDAHEAALAGEADAEALASEAAGEDDAGGDSAEQRGPVFADAPEAEAQTDAGGVGAVEGDEAEHMLEAVSGRDAASEGQLQPAVEKLDDEIPVDDAGESERDEESVADTESVSDEVPVVEGEDAAEALAGAEDAEETDGGEPPSEEESAPNTESAEADADAVAEADEESVAGEESVAEEVPVAEGEDAAEALAGAEDAEETDGGEPPSEEESAPDTESAGADADAVAEADEESVAGEESVAEEVPVAEGEDAAEALAGAEDAEETDGGEPPSEEESAPDTESAEADADAVAEADEEPGADDEIRSSEDPAGSEVPPAAGEDTAEALTGTAVVDHSDGEAAVSETAGDPAEQPERPTSPPLPTVSSSYGGGRVRQWLRRRRNR